MERKKILRPALLEKVIIILLGIFYTIGIYRHLILKDGVQYTAVFLTIISLICIAFFIKSIRSYSIFLIIAGIGFLVEVLGVNTGIPFGDYSYGTVLGIKILATPVLLSLMWGLIIITSSSIVPKAGRITKSGRITTSLLAGMLALMFDLLLEVVAVRLGYWSWVGPVPIMNYLSWFAITAMLVFITYPIKTRMIHRFMYFYQMIFMLFMVVFL